MSMQTPEVEPPPSKAPVVIRIILGVLFLLPGACGGVFLGGTFVEWAENNFHNRSWSFAALFIIPSAGSILLSVLLVGILLRFARWKNAPIASLVLSIVSVLIILLAHRMMLDTFVEGDTESAGLMLIVSVACFAAASVPPFLHWWNAR